VAQLLSIKLKLAEVLSLSGFQLEQDRSHHKSLEQIVVVCCCVFCVYCACSVLCVTSVLRVMSVCSVQFLYCVSVLTVLLALVVSVAIKVMLPQLPQLRCHMNVTSVSYLGSPYASKFNVPNCLTHVCVQQERVLPHERDRLQLPPSTVRDQLILSQTTC
jgi:hypothetical protein